MKLLAFCVLVIACTLQPGHSSKVLVIAPAATCSHDNLTVAIIMVDQEGKPEIHVLVQNIHNGTILDKKKVQFEGNRTALIKLKVTPVDEKKWKEDFVRLVVKLDDTQYLETKIPLTSQRGHIFIQTDQPIYTPNSDVKSWLFAVTRQLNPIPFPLVVDIVNPDGVVVKRMKKSDWQVERMVVLEPFHIPAITRFGDWKIVSWMEDKPQFNYTTGFKVQEYVLPTFDVSITSEQPYLNIYNKTFTIHIKAKHMYGKPVVGRTHIRYGVKHQSNKTLLSASEALVHFEQGEATHTLRQEHILEQYPDPKLLLGQSLYVEASVISSDAEEIENALLDDIPIVASPYSIKSKWTVPFFKPGVPYIYKTLVVNPDGSPAARVPVKVSYTFYPLSGKWTSKNTRSREDGIAVLVIKTPGEGQQELNINVQTEDERLEQSQQAEASFTISSYSSPSGSLIHLNTRDEVKSPGEHIVFDVVIKSVDTYKISHFNYLVISNGKIHNFLQEDRKGHTTSVSLLLTPELVPQFRLVAFFILPSGELVSDSIIIDVKDSCHAKLSLNVAGGLKDHYKPRDVINFELSGEADSWVSLSSVDKAAYGLYKHNKLTGKKVYKAMEASDLGRSIGAGRTGIHVFKDAGLAIMGRDISGMEDFTDQGQRNVRKRHTGESDRKIANDQDESCQETSLECCKSIQEGNAGEKDKLDLRQSQGEDWMIEETRSYFPENFMWEIVDLKWRSNVRGKANITKEIPDSGTTWDIQAVGISLGKGLCVGPSLELTVLKQFFLKVHTPYTMKQYEQVELRVVIYNYMHQDVKGEIEVTAKDGICTYVEPKSRFSVEKNSAASFSFMVVPLSTGVSSVSVLARVFGSDVQDTVEKELKVKPEGNYKEMPRSWSVQPRRHGGQQVIIIENETPENVVPGTEMSAFLIVQGNLVAETIRNTLEKNFPRHLQMPRGCGEQNMMNMSMTVMVARYLTPNDHWSLVADYYAEDRAREIISSGFTSQLHYRKSDYSYGAWMNQHSSTWLTAFVAKVFSQARQLVFIPVSEICGSVRWLMRKQNGNGSFHEGAPVVHKYMTGQVTGKVALTSFVFIAMLEVRETCINHVEGFTPAVERAHNYLTSHAKDNLDGFPLAITAYALSLWNASDEAAKFTMQRLNTSGTQTEEFIHWGSNRGKAAAVESTAYGLLAAIQHEEIEIAEKAANWLSLQSTGFGGYFQSTQDTVMALQALMEFDSHLSRMDYIDLSLEIRGEEIPPSNEKSLQITNFTAFNQISVEVPVHGKLTVTTTGTGQGVLTFVKKYREKVAIKKDCKGFSLEITTHLHKEQGGQVRNESINPEFNVYHLFGCFRYLREEDPGMVVMDISLPTGFEAKKKDLDDMKNLVNNSIVQYEIRPGRVFLYLDKVNKDGKNCVGFRISQVFESNLVLPVTATVFEYYEPDFHCSNHYHPKMKVEDEAHCHGNICKCLQRHCVELKGMANESRNADRNHSACQAEYVFIIDVKEVTKTASYININATLKTVLKKGMNQTVNVGDRRSFVILMHCGKNLNVSPGDIYLVMGMQNTHWRNSDRTQYILNSDMWFEKFPLESVCRLPSPPASCQVSENFKG